MTSIPPPIRWQRAIVLFDPAVEKPAASDLRDVECRLIWISAEDWTAYLEWANRK